LIFENNCFLFLQETIQTFERNLGEMVSNFTESMRANFSLLRELQAYFNESIANLCVAAVERILKGELEDEFPEDTREVSRINLKTLFFPIFFVVIY
jgi:hypothetical protein